MKKDMTFFEFCNEKADRRRFSRAHFGKRYFKKDMVLLNIGRYEYAASVNLDPVLSIRKPAKAAVDTNMDAVVWFGNDAHAAIGRTAQNYSLFWPFRNLLACREDYLAETMALMMKRVPLQNRILTPYIALVQNGELSNEELMSLTAALGKTGYDYSCTMPVAAEACEMVFGAGRIYKGKPWEILYEEATTVCTGTTDDFDEEI